MLNGIERFDYDYDNGNIKRLIDEYELLEYVCDGF